MADEETAADRLALALDLHDAGVMLMREKLRRDMPDASDESIEIAVGKWLGDRPGARHGDGVGVVRQRCLGEFLELEPEPDAE